MIIIIIVALTGCVTSKYDCAWKQKGYSGYGPASSGRR